MWKWKKTYSLSFSLAQIMVWNNSAKTLHCESSSEKRISSRTLLPFSSSLEQNPHSTQVSGTSESLSCLGSLCLWYFLELIDTWISDPLRLSSLGTLKLSRCFSNSQSHCQTLSPPPSLIRFSSVHLAYINNICQTLRELLKLLWINHYHFPLFCLSLATQLHKFVSKTIYPCQNFWEIPTNL